MRTMPAEMTWASLLGAAGASLIRLHSLLPLRVAARRVEGNLRTQRAVTSLIVAEGRAVLASAFGNPPPRGLLGCAGGPGVLVQTRVPGVGIYPPRLAPRPWSAYLFAT